MNEITLVQGLARTVEREELRIKVVVSKFE
jgi:hypothetical protein